MIRSRHCIILLIAVSLLVVVQVLNASGGIVVIPLQQDDAFRLPLVVSAQQRSQSNVPLAITIKVEDAAQNNKNKVSLMPRSNLLQTAADSNSVEAVNESFSACLLVMDENFRLREWIAYHYHVLPLRYMVVAVDPRSKHSPQAIFDQFQDKLNMTIISWNDTDFARFSPLPPNATPRQVIVRHDARQRRFLRQCISHMYQNNRTWTAMWDTDEYIAFNGYNVSKVHPATKKSTVSPPDMSKPGSILQYLKDSGEEYCIPAGRVLVGNKEVSTLMNETHPLDPRRFDTLRFRYRGVLGGPHGHGKCLVNVQKISSFPVKVRNPHRPVSEICPTSSGGDHVVNGPLYFNHYVGTWEAYSFRDDGRRGLQRSYEAYLYNGKHADVYDDKLEPWMRSFMTAVGEVVGKSLLQESGLDPEYNASVKIESFKQIVIPPDRAEIRRQKRLRRQRIPPDRTEIRRRKRLRQQRKRQQENKTSSLLP